MLRQIHVFPTIDLKSRPEVESAARTALFGPRMKVFSGGWSYYNRDDLRKLRISPLHVVSADVAEEVGLRFLEEAEARWAKAGQTSRLLPIDRSIFRLVRAETRQIWAKRRPLAWKLTWIILADMGAEAERPRGQLQRFVAVDMAEISLTVSLTGRVVGGSATWRPTGKPLVVDQVVRPDALHEKISTQRARANSSQGGDATGHDHVDGPDNASQESSSRSFFELRYSAGPRSVVTNFIDPRIHYIEPWSLHGPGLVVPITNYGLAAQILTMATRAETGQTAEITVIPWVTNCHGTVPMTPLPAGHHAHWGVVDLMEENDGEEEPHFHEGGAPLQLTGLAHVSFTVTNDQGCVAHAYEDICGALDPGELDADGDEPELSERPLA